MDNKEEALTYLSSTENGETSKMRASAFVEVYKTADSSDIQTKR